PTNIARTRADSVAGSTSRASSRSRARTGVELVPSAPAAARHELTVHLDDEIGSVLDEHRIGNGDVLHARPGLFFAVDPRENVACRRLHEGFDRVDVFDRCQPECWSADRHDGGVYNGARKGRWSQTQDQSASHRSVLRYFTPESASTITIVSPACLSRRSCSAATRHAPPENPAKMPSYRASRRAASIASTSLTRR